MQNLRKAKMENMKPWQLLYQMSFHWKDKKILTYLSKNIILENLFIIVYRLNGTKEYVDIDCRLLQSFYHFIILSIIFCYDIRLRL